MQGDKIEGMARANTYKLESGHFLGKSKCKTCGIEVDTDQLKDWKNLPTIHRIFFYPTFMNGDAEMQAEFCDNHSKDADELFKTFN